MEVRSEDPSPAIRVVLKRVLICGGQRDLSLGRTGSDAVLRLLPLAGKEHDVVFEEVRGAVPQGLVALRAGGRRIGRRAVLPGVSCPPWKIWRRPVPPPAGLYSAGSRPMRVSRHSSVSDPPVEMAMSGMSPSVWFFGKLNDLFGCWLSWHIVTVGIVICLRHLPTWMTSGMFVPSGAFGMVKWPDASVSAVAIGSPV